MRRLASYLTIILRAKKAETYHNFPSENCHLYFRTYKNVMAILCLSVVWEYGDNEMVGWPVAKRGIRQHAHVLRHGSRAHWLARGRYRFTRNWNISKAATNLYYHKSIVTLSKTKPAVFTTVKSTWTMPQCCLLNMCFNTQICSAYFKGNVSFVKYHWHFPLK